MCALSPALCPSFTCPGLMVWCGTWLGTEFSVSLSPQAVVSHPWVLGGGWGDRASSSLGQWCGCSLGLPSEAFSSYKKPVVPGLSCGCSCFLEICPVSGLELEGACTSWLRV